MTAPRRLPSRDGREGELVSRGATLIGADVRATLIEWALSTARWRSVGLAASIGLIALGALAFASDVGGRHLELTPGVRGALAFGAALVAGLIGALSLEGLDVSETAAGVGVTTVTALGLEYAGGLVSLATSVAVLLAAIAGACTTVASARGIRQLPRWPLPLAAGFLVSGVSVLVILAVLASAEWSYQPTMPRPMLSQIEPESTDMSGILQIGIGFGLLGAWWLVPRSHVLEAMLGASVILGILALLGGSGWEAVGLNLIWPPIFVFMAVVGRVKDGEPPFPKRRSPVDGVAARRRRASR